MTQGPKHRRVLKALEPRSLMVVPMIARERVIGVMLWVSSSRSYEENDLVLAERLARLASLEVENAEHYRDLQRALLERDRVLGVVAHDLRNPLNVIAMSAELVRALPLSEDRRARQLDVILASAKRMDRLIQDLLDVARMEGDRLVPPPEVMLTGSLPRSAVAAYLHPLGHAATARPAPTRA